MQGVRAGAQDGVGEGVGGAREAARIQRDLGLAPPASPRGGAPLPAASITGLLALIGRLGHIDVLAQRRWPRVPARLDFWRNASDRRDPPAVGL